MKTKGLKKKTRLSPQEKKLLSYKKDCRNMYGESRARSRFAIAQRKAGVNQAFRHAQKQILGQLGESSEEQAEIIESKVKIIKKKSWRKVPDSPLGEFVSVLRTRRHKNGTNVSEEKSELLIQAETEDFRIWRRNRWTTKK